MASSGNHDHRYNSIILVGYGDSYPRTIFGRVTMFICAIYGVVVVSVMVVGIQNTLEFTSLEAKAFTCINKLNSRKELVSDASTMISKFLRFSHHTSSKNPDVAKNYKQFREVAHNFMQNVRHYKSIYDNDYSNEFFRQFDLLREHMKEVNFYLSVICKIIFNDKKYQDVRNLTNDDLLSIQMLASLKDKKEMDIMKDQFITNQKVFVSNLEWTF